MLKISSPEAEVGVPSSMPYSSEPVVTIVGTGLFASADEASSTSPQTSRSFWRDALQPDLPFVWLSGVLVCAFGVLVGAWRIYRLIRASNPVPL